MAINNREELHKLVDQIPQQGLDAASRYLAYLVNPEADPLEALLASAEEDDEPLTTEDVAAIEEARAEYAAGLAIPWEDVKRRMNERIAGQPPETD